MRTSRRNRLSSFVCLLLAGTTSIWATGIQLSPLVGRRSEGLYRSPSYNRAVDQYSRQADEDYTVRLGNLRLQLSLGLEGTYDDNINLTQNGTKDEALSLTPVIYSEIYWPLNPGFQVYSGLSLGYKWYAMGGEDADDEGLIVGGTDGSFNSQIGFDLRLGQTGLLSGSEEYSRNVDSFSTGPQRDDRQHTVNRNQLNLQYRNDFTDYTSGTAKVTHTNQWVDESEFDEQNHYSDFLDVALLSYLNRDLQAGPYGRIGMFRYLEDKHNNSDEVEGGLAMTYGTTERLVFSGSVGISSVSFDTGNNPTANDEFTGMTTQWAARYSNNEFTTHRLVTSYGAEQGNLDADVNFSKEWSTQYSISVVLREDLLLNADAAYIDSRESDGGDNFDLYRVGVGLGYRLTRDTTMDLRYIRDWRDSDDRTDSNYTRNAVTLRLVHRL